MSLLPNTEKPDEFEISRNSDEQIDEFKEPNYLDGPSSKVPLKKANCFPIAWLLFLTICLNLQIRPTVSKPTGVKCPNANNIKYRNPKTGLIDHCMVCPECFPSQQYSIPCGSTVDLGTGLGRCEDCPAGTFSDKYDKKPCQICKQCTDRVYLQSCTKYQNAICGRCKPGYTYIGHIFGCTKNTKTTKTTALPITVKTTATPSPTSKNHTTTPTTTKITDSASKPHTVQAKTSASPFINHTLLVVSEGPVIPSSTLARDGKASPLTPSQQTNPWIIATVVILGITLSLSASMAYMYYIYRKKRIRSSSSTKADSDEEAGIQLVERTNDEQLLKDFIHNNLYPTESLYKVLYKKRFGTWDFERVGRMWHTYIDDIDLPYITELARNPEANNPVKIILDKLCKEVCPPLTVRMFADSLKKINKKAYRILQPHFKKPAVIDTSN